MAGSKDAEWWLHAPDLLNLALALTIGGFLGGYKPGFWWTVLAAILVAAPLSFVTSLVSTRRASAYLRAHGIPEELQRQVLAPASSRGMEGPLRRSS